MDFGGVAESSKKLYTSNLKRLSPGELGDLSWLKNTKATLAKIDAIPNPNTRRSYYIACVAALKGKKGFLRAYKAYHKAMMGSNSTLNKEAFKSEHTKAKQAAVTWEKLSKATPSDQQGQLIVALYTQLPPRRCLDYAKMRVGKPTNTTDNWYHDGIFYFNQYKTGRKYGLQSVAVPDSVQALIPDQEWLLVHNGKPIPNSTVMGRLIKKAFGADVGVSLLRNVYLSEKYGTVMKDLRADTEAMATSAATAQHTYIK